MVPVDQRCGGEDQNDGYISPEFDLVTTPVHDDPPPKMRQKFPEKKRRGKIAVSLDYGT